MPSPSRICRVIVGTPESISTEGCAELVEADVAVVLDAAAGAGGGADDAPGAGLPSR